jgi:hypothetical protein
MPQAGSLLPVLLVTGIVSPEISSLLAMGYAILGTWNQAERHRRQTLPGIRSGFPSAAPLPRGARVFTAVNTQRLSRSLLRRQLRLELLPGRGQRLEGLRADVRRAQIAGVGLSAAPRYTGTLIGLIHESLPMPRKDFYQTSIGTFSQSRSRIDSSTSPSPDTPTTPLSLIDWVRW